MSILNMALLSIMSVAHMRLVQGPFLEELKTEVAEPAGNRQNKGHRGLDLGEQPFSR